MPDREAGPAHLLYERMMREAALRGWTNTELSRQVGVSRSTIDKLATQPRPPQSATVLRIAETLAIPDAEALALAGILPGSRTEAAPPSAGIADASDEVAVMLPRVVAENWENPVVRTLWGLDQSVEGRLGLIRQLPGLKGNGGQMRSSG